jgi:hypothetical protein
LGRWSKDHRPFLFLNDGRGLAGFAIGAPIGAAVGATIGFLIVD